MTYLENSLLAKTLNWSAANGIATADLSASGVGKVISFLSLPPGMAVGSYVRISGGIGTAESVLVTAVSGVAYSAGSITVTTAQTHTGAWSVGSASGGIQEALNCLPSGNGTVTLGTSNTIQIHAKVTFPSGRNTLDGGNVYNYSLQRASDYPNGNLLEFPIGAVTTVKNMWIQNSTYPVAQTSGAALHWQTRSNATVLDMMVLGGYIGYDFDGVAQIVWHNSSYTADANASQFAGAWIHDTVGNNVPVNIIMDGGFFSLNSTSRGLVIYAADLGQFSNLTFGGGLIQVYISRFGTNTYIAGLLFENCAWDNAVTYPVKMDGTGTTTNIKFFGGSISGDANGTNTNGIDIGYTNTIAITNWSVVGTQISSMGGSGIAVGAGATQGTISGCVLQGNNTLNLSDGGVKLAAGITDLTISGCIASNNGSVFAGHQKWAVGTVGAATGLAIVGNDFRGNESTPISLGAIPSESVIESNAGVPIPVYANNAAAVAGGLWVGAKYRTGADPDPVCTVH